MATSETIRHELIDALRLDLVGPDNNHLFATELLPESPRRWYLTGFLVPTTAPISQRADETAADEIDSAAEGGGFDDAEPPDRTSAGRSYLPSSMGLTVLNPPGLEHFDVKVSWGDYIWEGESEPSGEHAATAEEEGAAQATEQTGSVQTVKRPKGYRRTPHDETVTIQIPRSGEKPAEFLVPNSGGLVLVVTSRSVSTSGPLSPRLPSGTQSLSVFLVNNRPPQEERAYRAFAFQARMMLKSNIPFVARPDLRGGAGGNLIDEWDEQVADLQYRDAFEYVVGHGVSATALRESDGHCFAVTTTWIPNAEVERVAPGTLPDVELGMEALGTLVDGADAQAKLSPLVAHYREWIETQRLTGIGLEPAQAQTADELLLLAQYAAQRIEAGIALLDDPQILEAFRIANRAMGRSARQREAIQRQVDPNSVASPQWYPFQLAFILMNLKGIVEPFHNDRERVDLLFFPTGGGKTEAYLGLSAFAMVLRRFLHPGIRSSGMSVLMRYTLRLLTLDQLGRAAALICALELEREQNHQLGEWPFEIGLWVGSAATPNRMGYRGYTGPGADNTAYSKTRRFMTNSQKNPAPIPIENCPWCGTKFDRNSFRLTPNDIRPNNLLVHCVNYQCDFSGDRTLPILGVDEPIYRRLPAFLIATVDKFAALPWTGQTGALLGHVERYDREGFYGPCDQGKGTALGGPLPPPDLIIQDELHLISGPLGTIAGVYETAIDALASRQVDEKLIRPKIIASTATVRRATTQIRALFDRSQVSIFPPPGSNRRDSFFAKTEPSSVTPARMYVGVAAQGRSLKVVLLRVALALLSAGQTSYDREGGRKNRSNPVDPYMTFLGYFNSLRELGGSRRIVEDEVYIRLAQYARRRRRDPIDGLFTDRSISRDVLELTSRVPTNEVSAAKRRLALPFYEGERVDVALATNMISVGLDILRLGLMVVLGQPKTSAEYIQATSRVGRNPEWPGLVVTLLNIHKPRDRSHYERFETYHTTFYRAVEATSLTPFSPRALDRALPAALVALCRHGNSVMTPALGASEIMIQRGALDQFAQRFSERARNHRNDSPAEAQRLRDNVLQRCRSLLDDWHAIADAYLQSNTRLQYQPAEASPAKRLLYEPLNPELPKLRPEQRRFRANRSMRDVEPNVDLTVKNLNDWGNRP